MLGSGMIGSRRVIIIIHISNAMSFNYMNKTEIVGATSDL